MSGKKDAVNMALMLQADWLEQQGNWEAAERIRCCPYQVGQCYVFRLVTYHWVGRVVAVGPHELILTEASWILDSGRPSDMVADGLEATENAKYEHIPGEHIIGRGAIADCIPYPHTPPTDCRG